MSTDAREARLRRAAKRQGLKLTKSRVRDPRALTYDRWWIYDPIRSESGPGGGDGLTIQEVEDHLNGGQK